MRKFLSVFIAVAMVFVSCNKILESTELYDRVGEIENKVLKIEQMLSEMNTNISSLQTVVTALQSNDFVTGVAPITQNGVEIGYTITFSKSGTITIYHGKDGKDGTNGTDGKDGVNGTNGIDGTTPVIGVKQDTDGAYYWTVNGEWLLNDRGEKVKAVGTDGKDGQDGQNGANGEDGKDGVNGTDGKDGENGTNGEDGVTPQLKIEDDYWYVSYDNGASWTQLGKAKGEDGKDGSTTVTGGDCIFKEVTTDENNAYFTLADGTVITIPLSATACGSLTVTYIPKYKDEKVLIDGTTKCGEFDFIVTPKANAAEIAKNYTTALKMQATNRLTRAVTLTNMPITACTADTESGVITLTASAENLPETFFAGTAAYSAILTVNDKATSQFVKLAVAATVGEDNEEDVAPTANNTILYTSTDSEVVDLYTEVGFGANFVSNTYDKEANIGTILFDGDVTRIAVSAFQDCKTTLQTVILPSSVTKIDDKAFCNCGSLTDINFPEGITSIGTEAFHYCTKLNNVKLPNTLISIGDGCFDACTSFTSIIIPDSVKTIGSKSFASLPYSDGGMNKVTTVIIGKGITFIGQNAFDNSASVVYCKATEPPVLDLYNGYYSGQQFNTNVTIYVPMQSVDAYKNKWPGYKDEIVGYEFDDDEQDSGVPSNQIWYTSTTGEVVEPYAEGVFGAILLSNTYENGKGVITFDGNVTKIGYRAFYELTTISSISIPSTVTEIGGYAFYKCSGLTELTLPDGVTIIGDSAFLDCTALTTLDLGKSVVTIERCAVSNCGIVELVIPDTITTIGYRAIYSCDNLKRITIGAGITSIGLSAFALNPSLRSCYIKAVTPPYFDSVNWATCPFAETSALTIYVPTESVDVYKSDNNWDYYESNIAGYDF